MPLATHYHYRGWPFDMPRYCTPLIESAILSTTDRAQGPCRHCLRKLARLPGEHGVHAPQSLRLVRR